jgi:RNA polymerase sigma factor (sigma-70 family)
MTISTSVRGRSRRATDWPQRLTATSQRLTKLPVSNPVPPSPQAAGHGGQRVAWDALMVAAQAGDGAAYRRLLREISSWLKRYYSRRLPSSMIDDVSQEVLLAIHAKRHTYDPQRPFIAWLTAIARYKWIDAIRSLQSRETVPLNDDLAAPSHETSVTSPLSLERLLGTLKPSQAEVIRLVKLEGRSVEEASQATGQSVSLVKVNIHRGLKRLVAWLSEVRDE